MKNSPFHNNKESINNQPKINSPQVSYVDKKFTVDINKLLNRVKNNQLEEKKEKVIFFSIGILFLTFTGFLISFIR